MEEERVKGGGGGILFEIGNLIFSARCCTDACDAWMQPQCTNGCPSTLKQYEPSLSIIANYHHQITSPPPSPQPRGGVP